MNYIKWGICVLLVAAILSMQSILNIIIPNDMVSEWLRNLSGDLGFIIALFIHAIFVVVVETIIYKAVAKE